MLILILNTNANSNTNTNKMLIGVMGSQPNWLVVRFQEFCRSTALHGWSYLIKVRFFLENKTINQTKKKTLSLKNKTN
jgi:hypothetical protein